MRQRCVQFCFNTLRQVTCETSFRRGGIEDAIGFINTSADLASAWALLLEGIDVERKEEAHGALEAAKEQIGGMKLEWGMVESQVQGSLGEAARRQLRAGAE
eukprot:3730262-Rhodomonas_salina.1